MVVSHVAFPDVIVDAFHSLFGLLFEVEILVFFCLRKQSHGAATMVASQWFFTQRTTESIDVEIEKQQRQRKHKG